MSLQKSLTVAPSDLEFLTWPQVKNQKACREQIREIFFASSSRQNFSSEAEKEAFWNKWTELYFTRFPQLILLAQRREQLLGYLMGCDDSRSVISYYDEVNPSYSVFKDLFEEFPAHLHINTHPEARGLGVGSQLLKKYEEVLPQTTAGIHLVTSPSARNVGFYLKNGYDRTTERKFKDYPLLFMGKKLRN